MSENKIKTPETWQQVLKDTELRAMSGTLRQLDELIGNDDTTPKQLADIILKDVTLTSRVLMIANSVTHSRSQTPSNEGTLTQAIIRIGFKGLRAICISVAIMDSFLKKMSDRSELQKCITHSFGAAVHARNVAKKTGANEEEVFIAGLLQNLGELVFWCSTIPTSQLYLDLLECAVDTPEQAFKKLSGMDFQDMSKALATEWQLSDLLLKSLGADITLDTKAVHLGRRISQASKEGWDSPAINKVLQSQLIDLGFDIMNGMKFMRDGENEAKTLAASYDLQNTEQAYDTEAYDDVQELPVKETPAKSKKPSAKKTPAKKTVKPKTSLSPLIRR